MTDPDRRRTGQPEVDALLDQADAAHQAVTEIATINHAERIVSRARLAEHEALHERYQQAEAELTTASATGDAGWLASARRARDEASTVCDRVGRVLREEMVGAGGEGFRAQRCAAGSGAHCLAS